MSPLIIKRVWYGSVDDSRFTMWIHQYCDEKHYGNFMKYTPRLFKLQKKKKNAPFKSCLKNMFRPNF